jgi:2,4-dienoyl-CoA reductase-like NADH-dependent reductase (Old Yellow Enzyme family)
MAKLFSPLRLRSLEMKNRIVVSPMCEYSSTDGFSDEWHLVHLGSRAVGGAGLLLTEATGVSPEGRITPDDLGLWREEHIPGLERITRFVREQGAIIGVQLAHAGRKASRSSPWKGDRLLSPQEGGWTTVAPSAIPLNEGERAPEALDEAGIQKVVGDFARAAEYALRAGFQVIELHAAHGYLLHQFLSPLSNHRTDDYGGSFDNRIRLLCAVVTAVRKVWPEEYPLLVRISASDWHEQGWTPEESVRLAGRLQPLGVDLMDCSSGGILPGIRIPLQPGYQVPFAEAIRRQTGIPTGAVGLITSASQAEEVLQQGQADLVIFARQLLRDPYFALHAARELGVDVPWPIQYERAKIK